MYGLSSDPYDLHPELYSRGVHGHGTGDSSARLEDPKQQPQGFMGWQQPPAAHAYPSAGKLLLHISGVTAAAQVISHARRFPQGGQVCLMPGVSSCRAARGASSPMSVSTWAQLVLSWAELVLFRAGRKRPAAQLQADRQRSEMLAEDHRDLLRGERWKLQRVRSLSALPSDADLLAGLKQGEAGLPCFPDALNQLLQGHSQQLC